MEKTKAVLLKLTDDQFKELAHAKVESGEKSWESFILRGNARNLTANEYAVVKDGIATLIDGFEGVPGYEAKILAAKNTLEALQGRYEGHPTTVQAEIVRRALTRELDTSPKLLPPESPKEDG